MHSTGSSTFSFSAFSDLDSSATKIVPAPGRNDPVASVCGASDACDFSGSAWDVACSLLGKHSPVDARPRERITNLSFIVPPENVARGKAVQALDTLRLDRWTFNPG